MLLDSADPDCAAALKTSWRHCLATTFMKPVVVTIVDRMTMLMWNWWWSAFTHDLQKLVQEQRELMNAKQGKCELSVA